MGNPVKSNLVNIQEAVDGIQMTGKHGDVVGRSCRGSLPPGEIGTDIM